ncbi:MAG: carbon storage regulator CsrA [Epsilonproteobacteria bacterium]|nr:carbon storage regulator CsrA [Campylobacterota bacterium]
MLVLSRKVGESVHIGDDIEIKIISISKDKVKLGFEAPKNVAVIRSELREAVIDANIEASKNDNQDSDIELLKKLSIEKSE